MISAIEKKDIEAVWPKVAPLLQQALDRGNDGVELSDVKEMLLSGEHLLLIAKKENEICAAFTLNILEYPRKKVLSIILVGGTGMTEWEEEVMNVIYRIAKEQNLDAIRSNGRDGWTRKMKKYGYHKIYTVLERAVQ